MKAALADVNIWFWLMNNQGNLMARELIIFNFILMQAVNEIICSEKKTEIWNKI